MDGIFVSTATLNKLSPTLRAELLNSTGISSTPTPDGSSPHDSSDAPAEFTVALTRRLVEDTSDSVRKVLRTIAEQPRNEFMLSSITKPMGLEASDLMAMRGIWSGITRRARKVLGDPKAILVRWDDVAVYDEDEEYVDHQGHVAVLTHASLRQVFGL